MKKIVLIPDSFKGTLSSKTICEIMESQIKEIFPNASIIKIPVADGGEGSVDCFLSAMGGEICFGCPQEVSLGHCSSHVTGSGSKFIP